MKKWVGVIAVAIDAETQEEAGKQAQEVALRVSEWLNIEDKVLVYCDPQREIWDSILEKRGL